MNLNNLFFIRTEFTAENISTPYYLYRGYKRPKAQCQRSPYPISLHFGKDEMVFCFCHQSGDLQKLFTLPIAAGELNQQQLSHKIEKYWKMPVWKPPPAESDLDSHFETKRSLLNASPFSIWHGIEAGLELFFTRDLFSQRPHDSGHPSPDGKALSFHSRINNGLNIGKNQTTDSWEHHQHKLYSATINFRRLLLDFLFELEYATTFEDKNFFALQPVLQNNKLLDAITRKCRYLSELSHNTGWNRTSTLEKIPKPLREEEKSWLNVCYIEEYREVFTSANSIFAPVEDEVRQVLFHAKIGKHRNNRKFFFTKEDHSLRNQTATFFLRRYSITDSIKVLLPTGVIWVFMALALMTAMGDFFISKAFENPPNYLVGLTSFVLPVFFLIGLVIYYSRTKINLFKLLLPRLFLGIMLGWAAFCGSEEAWKAAVMAHVGKIVTVNIVLFITLSLYIFTDIRNKLIRVSESAVFRRTILLVFFAMTISFVQGYYVLQFQAKPMLENSGFLTKANDDQLEIKGSDKQWKAEENKLEILELQKRALYGIKNFSAHESFLGKLTGSNFSLYYIWSIHLSQFMMAILIGIILQLLWEDRPITEPL